MARAVVYEPGTVEPGWTTTEFYQTVFLHVITAVVAIGTLFKSDFDLTGIQSIVPSAALAASMIAQIVYNLSRAKVKSTAVQAAATAAAAAEAAKASNGPTTDTAAGGASGLGLPTV